MSNLIAVAIVSAIGGMFCILIWMTCNLLTVRKWRVSDGMVAKDAFLDVLSSAEKSLIVRAGDDHPLSLWRDGEIVAQVRHFLRSKPKLTVRVLFTERGEGAKLEAMQAEGGFRGGGRLEIRYLPAQYLPLTEVHGESPTRGSAVAFIQGVLAGGIWKCSIALNRGSAGSSRFAGTSTISIDSSREPSGKTGLDHTEFVARAGSMAVQCGHGTTCIAFRPVTGRRRGLHPRVHRIAPFHT